MATAKKKPRKAASGSSPKQQWDDHAKRLADTTIAALESGNLPRWLKPWKAGEPRVGGLPFNPVTRTVYKGGNVPALLMRMDELGSDDPRFYTYAGAVQVGGQVRKGEKSTEIVSVRRWSKREDGADGDDNAPGDDVKVKTGLVFRFPKVFHASQIDGLPPYTPPPPPPEAWRHAACEAVLEKAGVPIHHGAGDRAFYRPSTDEIFLPDQSQFPTRDGYFATALHEAGHATGHSSRLARDLSGSFGSESYAREELRAEFASYMAGESLGIGHDPGQHHAYIASWVKVLKEDPAELMRAAADAQRIVEFLGIEPPAPEAVANLAADQAQAQAWRAEFNSELLTGYALNIEDAGIDDTVLARYADLSAREAVQTYADDYDLTPVSIWDMRQENVALRSQRDGLKSALQRVLGDEPEPAPTAPQPKGVSL